MIPEEVFLPVVIFMLVYLAITFDLTHKAVAALLGVAALLIANVVTEHQAVGYVDFETILLLMGMMIIVGVLRKSGVFTLIAVRIAGMTQGDPLKILILFSLVTGIASAFLDNVTTVLIMVPIVIELTVGMGLDPRLYVISQAVVSNLGGTATLIGDPPNIIIGSKTGLTFNQFAVHLSPIAAISMLAMILYYGLVYREKFKPINTSLLKLFSVQFLLEKIRFDFLSLDIDRPFLMKALGCLAAAIGLFVLQTVTKITPGIVAMTVAMILLVMTRVRIEDMLHEVEWGTLLFFAGLFILVGSLEAHGAIRWVAENIFLKIGHNPYVITLTVLWVSGIVSGFLDNIPFTITMIPIVQVILRHTPIPHHILWWALSLGACFGGNLTLIGASANIVSADMAKRQGYEISFFEFFKASGAVTLISLMLCSVYLTIFLWASL